MRSEAVAKTPLNPLATLLQPKRATLGGSARHSAVVVPLMVSEMGARAVSCGHIDPGQHSGEWRHQRCRSSLSPMTGRRRIFAIALAAACLAVGLLAWRAAARPTYYNNSISLSLVAFPDPNHAWVAGDHWTNGGTTIAGGTIHATASGGASWHRQMFATDWEDPAAIAFADARHGWVVGNKSGPDIDNILLATTDGGLTWKRQPCRTTDALNGISCTGSHVWAVGAAFDPPCGVILVTSDGAAGWRQQYTTHGDLCGIAFADARHGWAVGDGVIVATTDGGRTWRHEGPVRGCSLVSVACVGARCAWAVGTSAANRDVILATTDGGTSWQVQHTGGGPDSQGDVGYHSVAFAGALHGWVVGPGGTILATTDGGRTWQRQRSDTRVGLYGVAFADARDGLVVGYKWEGNDPMAGKVDGSVVLRTTDGGATWTSIR